MAGHLAHVEKGAEHPLKVVLLHAFPLNKAMWTKQVDDLSVQAHVIALDIPGFGDTPALEGEGSLKDFVKAIKEFLDTKGIKHAVFGGCSWGGYMIFELFRTHPDLVSGMLLCDTTMKADTPEASEKRHKQIETLQQNGGNTHFIAEAMVPFVLAHKTYHDRETDARAGEIVNYCKETILKTSAKAVIQGLTAMIHRPDSTDTLPTINVPVLIIVGIEDKGTPVSASEAMKEKLPAATSRLEIIEEAGHLSPLEQPGQVNDRILKFFHEFKLL